MGCGGSTAAGGEGGAKKRSVDLTGKGIDQLPKPSDVQDLNVSENGGLKSLDGIGGFKSLEKIDANSCGLTAIPAEIEGAAALEELLLFANKIKDVPAALGKCTELTTINLFNNQVKKLPVELGKLTKLEEVNCAANKMMMTTDPLFEMWASVKILSLYENNLVRMGSLAPLLALEELRISNNNLEEMPKLNAQGHKSLTVFEIHKNRVATMDEGYFAATPALQRLSIWGNQLKALPSSLCSCSALVGLQAQENALETIPNGPYPATLETVFLQDNAPLTKIPEALGALAKLKRVNLSKLQLDDASVGVAESIKKTCMSSKDGIFWGVDGQKVMN